MTTTSKTVSGIIYLHQDSDDCNPWWKNLIEDAASQSHGTSISSREAPWKALIIVKLSHKDIFAISFSRGISLLKKELIEKNFGINIAKKVISNGKINHSKTTTIGDSIINQITNTSSLMNLYSSYEWDNFEIINALSGPIPINETNVNINGSNDSLTVNGPIKSIEKLIEILTNLKNYANSPSLGFDNELIPIAESDQIYQSLENNLNNRLHEIYKSYKKNSELSNEVFIDIRWELKALLYHDYLDLSFQVNNHQQNRYDASNYSDAHVFSDLMYLYKNKLKSNNNLNFIDFLKTSYLSIFNDEKAITKNTSAYSNIYFELTLAQSKYVLIHGNWYQLDSDFYTKILSEVALISDNKSGIIYPIFDLTKHRDTKEKASEGVYNECVATENFNTFCLDKKNYSANKKYKTNVKNNTVEPCDLIKPMANNTVMIHVKRGKSSAGFSHLINQAKNSTQMFLNEPDFRHHIHSTITSNKQVVKSKYAAPSEYYFPSLRMYDLLSTWEFFNNSNISVTLCCTVTDVKDLNNTIQDAFPIFSLISLASLHRQFKTNNIDLSLVRVLEQGIQLTIKPKAKKHLQKNFLSKDGYVFLASQDGSTEFSKTTNTCSVGNKFQFIFSNQKNTNSKYDQKVENNLQLKLTTSNKEMTLLDRELILDYKSNSLILTNKSGDNF